MRKLPKPLNWMLTILSGLLLIYVALAVLVYLLQRKLLYHPARAPGGQLLPAAAKAGLEPWEVNRTQIGWRTTNHHARASLLMFHGNAGHAAYLSSFLPGLQAATHGDVQAFLLEYPGYGSRPGEPSEASLIQAAQEALAALPANRPVYLLGQSLGCAVAAALWTEAPANRIQGAVLVVPFNNLQETAQHHIPIFPMGLLLKDRFPSDARLSRDRGPLVVALAGKDRVIPIRLGKKLYDGYPGRKKLMIVPNAGHNDLNAPEARWWREVLGFMAPQLQ